MEIGRRFFWKTCSDLEGLNKVKIYGVYPRHWEPGYDWFDRQVGLLVAGMTDAGVDSKLVLLADGNYCSPPDERLIFAQKSQMQSPAWWASHGLDAVVLEGAANAAYLPYLTAIHEAGIFVHSPLDSDGLVDPAIDFRGYWLARYSWEISRGRRLPSLLATAHTLAKWAVPNSANSLLLNRLNLLASFSAESPLAVARLRQYFRVRNRPDLSHKLHWLPHPVPCHRLGPVVRTKEQLIVSAARWNDEQKGPEMFAKAAAGVLSVARDYRLELAGAHSEELARKIAKLDPTISGRVRGFGRLSNYSMTEFLTRAKVFFSASRSEGFPNVLADAVCCGCSVVGPARVGAMHFFTNSESGNVAWARTPSALQNAVLSELEAWTCGLRDADRIAGRFRRILAVDRVVARLLALVSADQ
jgi:glycosyltransferase involved in cell wall biosynthesis